MIFAAAGFGTAGELALISTPLGVSAQAIWTSISFLVLIIFAVLIRRSWIILSGLILATVCSVLAVNSLISGTGAIGAGYAISGACFILAIGIGISYFDVGPWIGFFYLPAVFIMLASPILIGLGLAGDNRVLEMSLCFAGLIALILTESDDVRTRPVLTLASITIAAAATFLDGARSASLIFTMTIVAYGLLGTRISRKLRLSFLGFNLVLIVTAVTSKLLGGSWTGGDRGLVIGTISMNTNGRTTMWAQTLQGHDGDESFSASIAHFIFGSGPGASFRSSMATLGQPAPLNEFVRLWTDFGSIGLSIWIGTLLLLLIGLIRVFKTSRTRTIGALGLASAFAIVMFSITENMVGYSWVLIPVGLIYGLMIRRNLDSATALLPGKAVDWNQNIDAPQFGDNQ